MIPVSGTRVVFSLGHDSLTSQAKAENVTPEDLRTGIIKRTLDKFGYLQQDNAEVDLFVLPTQCIASGGVIPPAGTRVYYTVGTDPQKGKPSAENVIPIGLQLEPVLLTGIITRGEG